MLATLSEDLRWRLLWFVHLVNFLLERCHLIWPIAVCLFNLFKNGCMLFRVEGDRVETKDSSFFFIFHSFYLFTFHLTLWGLHCSRGHPTHYTKKSLGSTTLGSALMLLHVVVCSSRQNDSLGILRSNFGTKLNHTRQNEPKQWKNQEELFLLSQICMVYRL